MLARKIRAIELCAHELRGEQACTPKACIGEISIQCPRLIECYTAKIGAGKVRAIEARRLEVSTILAEQAAFVGDHQHAAKRFGAKIVEERA